MVRWKRERLFLVAISLLVVALALLGRGYNKVNQLEHELTSLKNQYNLLLDNYNELESRYSKVWTEQPTTLVESEQSLTAPYTSISEGEITWVWKDMDGHLHKWMLSLDSYRSWIATPKPYKTVTLDCNGRTATMIDYRAYVHPDEFSEVIPRLYQQCNGEWEFAQEAFNLVNQLTVYSEDIGEVPRWPVETLAEARGDCEDLTILFASLLKAAPYPYELSIVYIDTDNLTDPQYPNHVMVEVKADDWRIFVECSNEQGWNYYRLILGWFFKL